MKNYFLVLAILFTGLISAQTVRQVEDFDRIKIEINAQIEIVKSNKNEVMMSLADEKLKDVTVNSNNGALVISQTSDIPHEDLRIRIYTNSLTALSVSKGADVDLKNFGYSQSLVVQTSGKSSVDTNDMKIENLNIMRTSDSKVVAKYANNIKETVDNTTVVTR